MPTASFDRPAMVLRGAICMHALPKFNADLVVPSSFRPDIRQDLIYCKAGTSCLILPAQRVEPQHILYPADGGQDIRLGYNHPPDKGLVIWYYPHYGALLLARRQYDVYELQYSGPAGLAPSNCIIRSVLSPYADALEEGELPNVVPLSTIARRIQAPPMPTILALSDL